MMRTQRVVAWGALVAGGLSALVSYSSCGGTGGGVNSLAAFQQFVSQSCSPAGPNGGGNCLTLSVPNAVPADGQTVSGFRAKLIDGSGAPLPGVQICFAFENPFVATIFEPTNACGLTDQNGLISGQFRDGTVSGSFALQATAPAGFALQTRKTISFEGTTIIPGSDGSPCGSPRDRACATGLFCTTGNDGCFGNLPTCQAPQGGGACCSVGSDCANGCNFDTGRCNSTPGSIGVGGSCTVTADCQSGLFCGSGGGIGNAGQCNAPQPNGSACSAGSQCASNTCTNGTCIGAAGTVGPGGVCSRSADCRTGLFCGIGDGAGVQGQCNNLQQNGEICSIKDECASTFCAHGECVGAKGDPCAIGTDCSTGTCTAGQCA